MQYLIDGIWLLNKDGKHHNQLPGCWCYPSQRSRQGDFMVSYLDQAEILQ